MAIQLVPKLSAQTTKQVTRNFMTLPVIVVFLLVFFFVSTMKVKVVYNPATGKKRRRRKKVERNASSITLFLFC
jgi:uncharacterized membrane protein